MRLALILFSLSVIRPAPTQSAACSLRLTGRVFDAQTGQPLAFAAVAIAGTARGVYTDERGVFALEGLCPETFILVVSHVGCTPVRRPVALRGDTALTFQLDHRFTTLEEVVVQEKPVRPALTPEASLSGRALRQTRGQSLGQALTQLPGVSALQTGPTLFKPIVQGMYANRIAIVQEGVPLASQRWGLDHAPEIDPFAGERLRAVKGAAGVRYGPEAVGGAVVVDPPALPDAPGLSGEAFLAGQSNNGGGAAGAALTGGVAGVEGLGWRAQASGRYFGDARAPNYVLSNTGLRELNLAGAVGYTRSRFGARAHYSRFAAEVGILRGSHIGNLTDLLVAFEREAPQLTSDYTYQINNPKQTVTHQLFGGEAYWQPAEWGRLTLRYRGQRNDRREFDIRRGARSERPALLMLLRTDRTALEWQHAAGNWEHAAEAGYTYQRNRNRNQETGTQPLLPDYRLGAFHAFVLERYTRLRWEAEAGLRLDYRDVTVIDFMDRFDGGRRVTRDSIIRPNYVHAGVTASLSGRYHLTEQLSVGTHVGLVTRPPALNEMYSQGLHHGAAAIEEGLFVHTASLEFSLNPDTTMPNEWSLKWSQTVTYRGTRWNAELTGYAQRFYGYIFLKPQPEPRLTVRGAFPLFFYEQEEENVHFWGLDAMTRYRLTDRLTASAQAALVRARRETRGDGSADPFLPWVPPDRFGGALTYTMPGWGAWQQPSLTVRAQRTREQTRFTPATDYVPPPEGFTLVGAEVSVDRPLGAGRLGISVSADNIFNAAYREYLDRQRYFADAPGRNFTLRFNYQF